MDNGRHNRCIKGRTLREFAGGRERTGSLIYVEPI